jgi:hypothetical protein
VAAQAAQAAAAAAAGKPQQRRRLTSVLFARNAPVLVVGDDAGGVEVYRVHGVGGPDDKDRPLAQQRANLEAAMNPDGAQDK